MISVSYESNMTKFEFAVPVQKVLQSVSKSKNMKYDIKIHVIKTNKMKVEMKFF
jgi:hypothetical protein